MANADNILRQVLNNYSRLGGARSIHKLDAGLINKTYLVDGGHGAFILQEISPIFDTTIHEDSQRVSRHLDQYKIPSPKILPTDFGALFCREDGRVFRALEYIAGQTFDKVGTERMAHEAGRVLGEFHGALENFDYVYKSQRPHGGNYDFHKENLIKTLSRGEPHDYFAQAQPLAQEFLRELRDLSGGLVTTPRHAHGDPKISNILFDQQGCGICLIDFDTLSKSGWSLELADAMRSWCNKNREDVLESSVDLSTAQSALRGYGRTMAKKISAVEIEEFVIHTQAITLCLAMRYLGDVINENYFAFDSYRFARAADHNLVRAQAMYNLFREFKNCAPNLKSMAQDLLL